MAFGLGVLRLSSRDFWALTPRELFHAAEGVYGPAAPPMSRGAFDALMRAFPDGEKR